MAVKLDIVTPRRTAWSGTVESVQVPGEAGEFGVLQRHVTMLSTLLPGRLALHGANGQPGVTLFDVGTGFAEVTPERVVVLVESCEPA